MKKTIIKREIKAITIHWSSGQNLFVEKGKSLDYFNNSSEYTYKNKKIEFIKINPTTNIISIYLEDINEPFDIFNTQYVVEYEKDKPEQ